MALRGLLASHPLVYRINQSSEIPKPVQLTSDVYQRWLGYALKERLESVQSHSMRELFVATAH